MHTPWSLRALSSLMLLIIALGWGALVPAQSGGGTYPPAGTTTTPTLAHAEGAPRGWEGGMQVSPVSVVNARTGMVFTAVPTFGWDPFGPAIAFNFYHSSYAGPAFGPGEEEEAPSDPAWYPPAGNQLIVSPSWRTSYSSTIDGSSSASTVTVIEDDGTRNDFAIGTVTSTVTHYTPPAGVFDRLWYTDSHWHLRRPDQTERVFDSSGKLLEERDLHGRAVTIARTSDTDWYIQTAAHNPTSSSLTNRLNQIHLKFDSSKRLIKIIEEIGSPAFASGPTNDSDNPNGYRMMVVGRDSTTKILRSFYLHSGSASQRRIDFTYDCDDASPPAHIVYNIRSVTSGSIVKWEYTYATDYSLASVTQTSLTDSGAPVYSSSYAFGLSTASMLSQNSSWNTKSWWNSMASSGIARNWTKVTDRRGKKWWMAFPDTADRTHSITPLGDLWVTAADSQHNITSMTNPLGKTWSATYGSVGNVLTTTTPISGQTSTLAWEPVLRSDDNGLFTNSTTNFYRLTSTTDPLSRTTTLTYGINGQPENVTLITQPAPYTGAGQPETTLEYGTNTSHPGEFAQLTGVVDPNGVRTAYEYNSDYASSNWESREYGFIVAIQGETGDASPQTGSIVPIPAGQGGGRDGGGNWRDFYCDSIAPGASVPQHYNADGTPSVNKCQGVGGTSLAVGYPLRLGNVPSPSVADVPRRQCGGHQDYDDQGRLIVAYSEMCDDFGERSTRLEYDAHGRLGVVMSESDEATPGKIIHQEDAFAYDEDGRPTTAVTSYFYNGGSSSQLPPGNQVIATYDDLGRPASMAFSNVVGTSVTQSLAATLQYDAAGRLIQTDYGNGVRETRSYDDADRPTMIAVEGAVDGSGRPLLTYTTYSWSLDNTISQRVELNVPGGDYATTDFAYDNLGRLTSEVRNFGTSNDPVYSYEYSYDLGGNRLSKIDHVGARSTQYFYDIQYPDFDPTYPTRANRLLGYAEFGEGGPPSTLTSEILDPCASSQPTNLLRTVRYTYYKTGDVSNIAVKDAGSADWRDLALYYNRNGTLAVALWDSWKYDENCNLAEYSMIAAKEFRFSADPRHRYMTRELSIQSGPRFLQAKRYTVVGENQIVEANWNESGYVEAQWTSGLGGAGSGGQPLDDVMIRSNVNASTLLEPGTIRSDSVHEKRYTGTAAERHIDPAHPTDPGYLRVNHGDLIGSTQQQTDDDGVAALPKSNQAYTAFGEYVDQNIFSATDEEPIATRYQYAGAWAYESGLLQLDGAEGTEPIRLVHVGARWYQPSIGRFVQRDPIGIRGGMNVYEYCGSNPLHRVDPRGHGFWDGENFVHEWIADHLWAPLFGTDHLAKMSDTEMYAWGIGVPVAIGVCIEIGVAAGGASAAEDAEEMYAGLGDDPAIGPPGTEWRGAPGSTPGGPNGNYYDPITGESFHPDLSHPDPIGPHWDYRDIDGVWWRIFPNGTFGPK